MSPIQCPRCQEPCLKLKYESIEIDQCAKCTGIWLDPGELEQVIATKEEQFSDALTQSTIRQARAGVPDSEINAPLACPICKTATQVLNFDYNSGVIVNRCIKHGVWFDANELMRIQAFMEHWEVHKSKLKAQWQKDYDRIQGETAKLVSELDSAPLKSSLTVRILYFLMNKGKL